jgi:Protein of unknown function (DUF2637)
VKRSDKAIRVLTTFAVLVVAAIAAVISFTHIAHLALTHGQTVLAAMLLPLSIDGTVAAASLVMLRSARMKLPTSKLARVMLALSVLATLACNVLFGAGFGIVGALLSGWPAVAFIGCAEMAIGMIRRTRAIVPETVADVAEVVPIPACDDDAGTLPPVVPDAVPTPVPEAVARTVAPGRTRPRPVDHTRKAERRYAAELAEGRVPSLRAVMRDIGVGQDKARDVRAHLASLITGPDAAA